MKKWFVVIIILVTCGVVFFIFSQPPKEKLSKEKKEEAIGRLTGRKANLDPNIKVGDTSYKGKYISFSYPAKATPYAFREESFQKNTNDLEPFSFDLRNPRMVFNFKALSTTLTNLDDEPSVRLRRTRSYEYKESKMTVGKYTGIAFTKSDKDYEKTGFLIASGKLYTFSVTGTTVAEVEKLFDEVIKKRRIIGGIIFRIQVEIVSVPTFVGEKFEM